VKLVELGKRRKYLEGKIIELETNNKNKNIRGINEFRK
jgi:predicted nuclease of restriction endonuclease-like RecB superfamily